MTKRVDYNYSIRDDWNVLMRVKRIGESGLPQKITIHVKALDEEEAEGLARKRANDSGWEYIENVSMINLNKIQVK